MSRESFLRTVVANPEEDSVRLVFADWLDEYGDETDHAHAELIRAQIALERLPLDDDRRAEFKARAERVRYTNGLRERLQVPRCVHGGWSRGFPVRAGFDWNDARKGRLSESDLAEIAAAMEHLPIRTFAGDLLGCGNPPSAALPPEGQSGLELLAAWPGLARLTALEVTSGITPYEDRGDFAPGLRALAGSPQAGGLRSLRLGGWQLTGDSHAELGRSAHLLRLAELTVTPPYGDDEVAAIGALARTPLAARLERLSCSWIDLGAAAVRDWLDAAPLRTLAFGVPEEESELVGVGPLLGAPGLSRLRELHITGEEHGFGVDEMPYDHDRRVISGLADLLACDALGGLEALSVRGVALGDDGVRALASAACARSLVELDLSLCGLTGEGLRALRPLLTDGHLRRLSLGHNELTRADAEEVASWPEFGRLHELDVGYFNHMEGKGSAAFKASPHRHPFLSVT